MSGNTLSKPYETRIMTTKTPSMERIARQHLKTNQLLGVDFLPKREGITISSQTKTKSKSKREALKDLHTRHDATCPHCTTAQGHTQTVFGEGDPEADLMFIGEAPGAEEDRTGRPFVGRAGKKLEEIINAMGMKREDVFIANVLKSRPPDNRTPLAGEVEGCSPFLAEQIKIIDPKVIVTLGGPATKLLLKTDTGITRLRGQWALYRDGDYTVDVMPTFHPAYLLRNYTVQTRKEVWSDMQSALEKL
ncbi:MAG: uracil-DNA glycosylase [Planctomycetota bacterium]|nr:uracil-DNA glycosylase [Planctomycetota bacterium]